MRRKDRDPEGLLAAACTDPHAFGAFYRLFERRILGYFVRATGSSFAGVREYSARAAQCWSGL
jgi:hypothetical protein